MALHWPSHEQIFKILRSHWHTPCYTMTNSTLSVQNPLVELLSYKLYMQHTCMTITLLQTTLLLSAIRLYVSGTLSYNHVSIQKSYKYLTLQLFQSWILILSLSPIPAIHTCTLFHYINTDISTLSQFYYCSDVPIFKWTEKRWRWPLSRK